MELPQVARYTDSQRYVEHYDGVDPHTPAGKAFVASGGQRVATVLMYLNDVAEGGSTAFSAASSAFAVALAPPPAPAAAWYTCASSSNGGAHSGAAFVA